MGMDVNGGSYNWTAWRMIEASIKMVCFTMRVLTLRCGSDDARVRMQRHDQ